MKLKTQIHTVACNPAGDARKHASGLAFCGFILLILER